MTATFKIPSNFYDKSLLQLELLFIFITFCKFLQVFLSPNIFCASRYFIISKLKTKLQLIKPKTSPEFSQKEFQRRFFDLFLITFTSQSTLHSARVTRNCIIDDKISGSNHTE